ncbi:MAG: ATP-binding cassette domain-containing protein [Bacilli bacterium]|jgi:oligopeptide transport system ATP-binding protein|nr:ATP-binding cassette domain-containing protein [Bacilli bacterium]MCI2055389.1 ATP-binding cassette domain-containing protein [Bacilli bacterium]
MSETPEKSPAKATSFKDDVILEVKHLKMYFPTQTGFFKTKQLKAVDDVSFFVRRGETLGIVGESGCGKTTLGRTILNLYKPTAGTIIFNGREIKSKADVDYLHLHAQMVFQDPYSSLDPRMTVEDIIAEPLDAHKNLFKEEKDYKKFRHERVASLMQTVGLSPEQATRYPHEFSGGQRQRIGIARSLALNPELVVCDEPVSALDVSIQAQVLNTFEELQAKLGLTYLFVAHNLLVVKHISDRIAVMYLGHVVELAESGKLFKEPMHPYTVSLLSAIPVPDPKAARKNERVVLKGDIPSPLNAPSGCPFRTRCPFAKDACASEKGNPVLREVRKGHYVACLFPLQSGRTGM